MAGNLRYWKEKDGRFWARIAVPKRLQAYLDEPRSELIQPLGGDRRAAIRHHPAAVAKLQQEIAVAEKSANESVRASRKHNIHLTPITTRDFGRAVWQRYTDSLEADDATRERYPSKAKIADEWAKFEQRSEVGADGLGELATFAAALDFMILKEARNLDHLTRKARLAALQRELAAGETHQVEHEIDAYIELRGLSAEHGTPERAVLAKQLMRAEIEALLRTLERDLGQYTGQPADPIVRAPATEEMIEPVNLSQLWDEYLKSRVQAGFAKDGGRRQAPVIRCLISHLGHNDARRVTKKDLILGAAIY